VWHQLRRGTAECRDGPLPDLPARSCRPQLAALVSEPLPPSQGQPGGRLPLNLANHLHTKISELVESTFLRDVQQVGRAG
jgi:hypothetical protein